MLGSNDRFFNYYFNCCIAFVSSAIATVNNITPGKFDMNYYMCTGENPSKYDFLGKKVSNPLSCHTQNIQNIFFFKHHIFLLIKVVNQNMFFFHHLVSICLNWYCTDPLYFWNHNNKGIFLEKNP